jgi:hypothetical protein
LKEIASNEATTITVSQAETGAALGVSETKVDASKEASNITISQAEARAALGISRPGLQDAKAIQDYAPELEKVLAGKTSLRAAATQARKRSPRANSKQTKSKPPPRPRIVVPYQKLEVATPEETLRPPPGSPFTEIAAWRDRIGSKVPLYSMNGKELLDARGQVLDYRTCKNAAVVCRAFERSRRRDLLSFGHRSAAC